jgi:hypothetical protein
VSSWLAGVEGSVLAARVRDSLVLTAGLSAVHVVGFTLTMGGALLANLRLAGAVFRDRPVTEIVRPALAATRWGLAVSVLTGLLLFAPRATAAAANSTFQLKMALLVLAAAYQFLLVRSAARSSPPRGRLAMTGVAGLLIWTSLAATACAYILLE